jgi:hypothetical protein
LLALDLENGERREHPFGDEELNAVATHAGATYLVLTNDSGGGAIAELYPRSLSTRRIQAFQPGEEVLGLSLRGERTELPSPHLVVRTSVAGSATTPLKLVDLPQGYRWPHELSVSYEELYDSGMPLPAVSDSTVALVYAKSARRGFGPETRDLVFLDLASGRLLDSRILTPELGRASRVELHALGDALILLSDGRTTSRLEVWVPRR